MGFDLFATEFPFELFPSLKHKNSPEWIKRKLGQQVKSPWRRNLLNGYFATEPQNRLCGESTISNFSLRFGVRSKIDHWRSNNCQSGARENRVLQMKGEGCSYDSYVCRYVWWDDCRQWTNGKAALHWCPKLSSVWRSAPAKHIQFFRLCKSEPVGKIQRILADCIDWIVGWFFSCKYSAEDCQCANCPPVVHCCCHCHGSQCQWPPGHFIGAGAMGKAVGSGPEDMGVAQHQDQCPQEDCNWPNGAVPRSWGGDGHRLYPCCSAWCQWQACSAWRLWGRLACQWEELEVALRQGSSEATPWQVEEGVRAGYVECSWVRSSHSLQTCEWMCHLDFFEPQGCKKLPIQ